MLATSDYDDIDWGEIQFSEIDWSKGNDSDFIDWGEVQWGELDNADYSSINWRGVAFSELDSNDLISINSSISSLKGLKIGTFANDAIQGGSDNDLIFGLRGNDKINGAAGNDQLIGSSLEFSSGRAEIDQLTGGVGKDVFILGSEYGSLYDDGILNNAGRNDYALITDFTVGEDKLQLSGSKNNYFLGASGVANISGAGLFYDSNANAKIDSADELLAIIRSANGGAINAANTVNTAQFI